MISVVVAVACVVAVVTGVVVAVICTVVEVPCDVVVVVTGVMVFDCSFIDESNVERPVVTVDSGCTEDDGDKVVTVVGLSVV